MPSPRALFKSPLSTRVPRLMIGKLDKPAYIYSKPLTFIKELGLSRDLLLTR
jgi:hypothetical protein